MSFPQGRDIVIGATSGWRSIKVPGRHTSVEQTFVPIAPEGIFRTPKVGSEVSLRVRAGGNTNDSFLGTGARVLELYGLDKDGYEITEQIATAGTLASSLTQAKFLRLFEARIVESGTYATQSAGSQFGDIIIEDSSGNFWTSIPLNGFPEGRSRIGVFTVPANYEAFLHGYRINADSGKTVDALLFQRSGVLETAAPYKPMLLITEIFNITGFTDFSYDSPIHLPPLTDIGIMCTVDAQSARVGTELGLWLRRV